LEKVEEWNKGVEESNRWNDLFLKEISSRFEVPLDRNKWERLLFTVKPDQNLQSENIISSIFSQSSSVPRNSATEIVFFSFLFLKTFVFRFIYFCVVLFGSF
jgi:tRNA uridine 5-carbamoylmethylation protein Kti12